MSGDEWQNNTADAKIAFLAGIERRHRDIDNLGLHRVQAKQQVSFEKITRVQLVERQKPRNIAMNRDVAVGRVETLPVPGRHLGKKREDCVSDQPDRRHGNEIIRIVEPIAFGEVGLAAADRCNERGKKMQVNLAVAVHLDDDAGPISDRLAHPRYSCASYAPILLVKDNSNAGIPNLALDQAPAPVWALVVDHV